MLTCYIFLSLIACTALPAASELIQLPYEGEQTAAYAQHDEFFVHLRNNNVPYVVEHLGIQSRFLSAQAQYRYGGKLTLLHIITAMEHFHGHNPKPIIHALAEQTSKHHFTEIYLALTHDCKAKANVNHPDFYYLCTGKKQDTTGLPKLMLSPIELARAYKSIKTLCALAAHTTDTRSDIRNLFSNLFHQSDPDVAERIIAQEHYRARDGRVHIDFGTARPIIANFGTAGMRLMHRYNIELFSIVPLCGKSLYDIFTELHPDKVHEIDDLKPAPEVGLIQSIKNFFRGESSSTATTQSPSSSFEESEYYSEESEEGEEDSDLENDQEEV